MARKLQVEIIGDASSLQRAFGKAGSSTSKFGTALGTSAKFAGVALAGLSVGAAMAGRRMVDMASDAAEVQSKMEVVFGKTLPGLTKEIDKFSKATGTSRFEMREQVANMGALLRPMLGSQRAAGKMSLQFTKLATDLGSFNNIPAAEALEKIRAGLVGEAEPLRSLGVLLTEASTKEYAYANGIAKRGAELTEVQKVEARAGQIMAQTALAQGDATRTAGSMANQMKALRTNISDAATEIGMALIPHALKAVQAFNTHWPKIKAVAGDVFGTIGRSIQAFVGFMRTHWGTISTVATTAFNTVRAVAEAVWPRVQAAAARVVAWYRGTLQPAIQNVMSVLSALWQRFGADITRIAGTAFNTARTVIVSAMRVIQGVIEGVLAVIRGDWDQAWKSLKQVVSAVMTGVAAILRGFVSIAFTAMMAVGRALVEGVLAGASGLASRLGNQLKSEISSAVSSVKGFFDIRSPSGYTAKQIGAPLGEGIIAGFLSTGTRIALAMVNTLRGAAAASVAEIKRIQGVLDNIQARREAQDRAAAVRDAEAALAAARKKKEGVAAAELALARAREDIMVAGLNRQLAAEQALLEKRRAMIQAKLAKIQDVVQSARDKMLTAFDRVTGGFIAPAAGELGAIRERRQQEDLARAVEDAQARLSEAQQGDDPAAVVAAQRALTRAQEDITINSLEKQQAAQEAAWAKSREGLKTALEARLDLLSAYFQKEGATAQGAMARLQAIMSWAGSASANGASAARSTSGKAAPIVTQVILDGKVIAENTNQHLGKAARRGQAVFAT